MPASTTTSDSRRSFLEAIAPESHFHRLFEHLPGISFFAKNDQSEIMAANRWFLERFGFTHESQIVGKTDYELFPGALAEHFREDDLEVIRSKEPKLGIVELFLNRQGIPDWFITNKMPILSRDGNVIGVMGTVQNYEIRRRIAQPYGEIGRAVEFVRDHFRESIQIRDLARMVGLSVRQFDRRFKESFNMTPKSFLIKTRIQAACEHLRDTDDPISDVACDLGFCDQSSFTFHFRRQMGITPLRYRRQFRLRACANKT